MNSSEKFTMRTPHHLLTHPELTVIHPCVNDRDCVIIVQLIWHNVQSIHRCVGVCYKPLRWNLAATSKHELIIFILVTHIWSSKADSCAVKSEDFILFFQFSALNCYLKQETPLTYLESKADEANRTMEAQNVSHRLSNMKKCIK